MRLRNLAILSFCAIFLACSNDDKIKPDNTQNQNPDNIVKYIGKYPEKFIFKIDPKGSISDYGAYYFTIQKNNKDGNN